MTGPPELLTPKPELVDIEINHWCGVQRQHLAKDETADDGDAKGRRNSLPSPIPIAKGSAPSMAAIVVIMMGLKRSRQAS